MLFYRAALPLSRPTLLFVAGVIRRHRKATGSCWRKLNPGQQAVMALAYLRKGETFAELGAGFGVGTATAWRYVNQTVALLAARSPRLRQALRKAGKDKLAYLVLDGTLIPVDRVAADRPFYCGKHKKHRMNLQVIATPNGEIRWVSGPLPGAVHDLRAARTWGIVRELAAFGLIVLADKGYAGAGQHIITPYYAVQANARTPSSRPGASCASSAAAPGEPGAWPRPSTSCRPARTKDEGPLIVCCAGLAGPPALYRCGVSDKCLPGARGPGHPDCDVEGMGINLEHEPLAVTDPAWPPGDGGTPMARVRQRHAGQVAGSMRDSHRHLPDSDTGARVPARWPELWRDS